MLDKSKIYAGFSRPYKGYTSSPCSRFRRVRILYEDDISYYVASLTRQDRSGFPVHYSVKKHIFELIAIDDIIPECCKVCSLHKTAMNLKINQRDSYAATYITLEFSTIEQLWRAVLYTDSVIRDFEFPFFTSWPLQGEEAMKILAIKVAKQLGIAFREPNSKSNQN